jgi:hypothetical protein
MVAAAPSATETGSGWVVMVGAVVAAVVLPELLPPPQAVSVEHTRTAASASAGEWRFKADSFYW